MPKKLSVRLTRQLFIVMVLLVVFSSAVFAAPLKDVPVTVNQPDGDILNCLASGDEFFNYLHDARGNIIIQDPDTGYYTYARLDDGGRVIASRQIAVNSGYYYDGDAVIYAPALAMTDGLKLSGIDFSLDPDLINEFYDPEDLKSPSQSQDLMPTPSPDVGITGKTLKGEMENIIILICFADENPAIPTLIKDKIEAVFNGSSQSLNHYLKAVSENVFELHSTLVGMDGDTVLMYQDSHPRRYYQAYNAVTNPDGYTGGDNGAQRTSREHSLLRSAVTAINGSSILAGKNLDITGNGRIDSIAFFINGNTDGWNSLLWPHKWSLYSYTVNLNGKRVYDYSFQLLNYTFPASGSSNLSVICHESLHTFGLPDLYRYTSNGTPVGAWDVMASNTANPQFPDSHLRLRYTGWGEKLVEITKNGRYVLSPVGSTKGITAYAIKTSNSSQFILLEYRSNGNPSGYDTYFGTGASYSKGLTIARINTAYSGNANSSGTTNDEVYIYRSGETASNKGNGSYTNASLSSDKGRTSFGNDTVASGYDGTIYLYNGTNTKFLISNVSLAGETISFEVKIDNSVPGGHAITYLAGNNGTLSARKGALALSSGDSVANGDSVTFTAAPNPNYIVDNWFVNGVKDEAAAGESIYELSNINISTTVICTFRTKPDLSGIIKSYDPLKPVTIELIRDGNTVDTATITAKSGSGLVEQEFVFKGVEPGRYELVITKAAHTKYTVKNLVVKNEDLNLSQDSRPEAQIIALRCGDINSDGLINDADLTILWRAGNYNKKAGEADNSLCDLNGDGLINDADLTILWLVYNYNRGSIVVDY